MTCAEFEMIEERLLSISGKLVGEYGQTTPDAINDLCVAIRDSSKGIADSINNLASAVSELKAVHHEPH
jgi:hypothetical protein